MPSTLQLTRYDGEGGIEILINSITGESFLTADSYAKFSGVDKTIINSRLKSLSITLICEDLIAGWIQADNPNLAKKLFAGAIKSFGSESGISACKSISTSDSASLEVQESIKSVQESLGMVSRQPKKTCRKQTYRSKAEKTKLLYILQTQDEKYIKIGISRDPNERAKGVQTGCPMIVSVLHIIHVGNARRTESQLHSELVRFRSSGEWFHSAALNFIDLNSLS